MGAHHSQTCFSRHVIPFVKKPHFKLKTKKIQLLIENTRNTPLN